MSKRMKRDPDKLYLSPSSVKTYEQCPRKYYYNYIKKLPKKEMIHLHLGTFCHDVLEQFHIALPDANIVCDSEDGTSCEDYDKNEQCVHVYRRLMNQIFPERKKVLAEEEKIILPKQQLTEAQIMVKDYIENLDYETASSVLYNERKFVFPLTDKYMANGIMDRIDVRDGVYHLVDYKTNKNAKYMEPFQLYVYGLALDTYDDIDGDTSSIVALYKMLRLNRELPYKITPYEKDECKRKLIEFGDKITSDQKWIMKAGPLCNWCDYKDICFNPNEW